MVEQIAADPAELPSKFQEMSKKKLKPNLENLNIDKERRNESIKRLEIV